MNEKADLESQDQLSEGWSYDFENGDREIDGKETDQSENLTN